jgi:F5/8 type C domain
MRMSLNVARLVGVSLCVANVWSAAAGTSEWVSRGPDGKLVYKTTEASDRIMDFSHAGYKGGGVALPDVPVKVTVHPVGPDDETAKIQSAIDQVAAMPIEDGFRGAVLLGPGTFTCARSLSITAGGIVLRGSGSGDRGTTIRMTGERHSAITIGSGRGRAATQDDEPQAGQESQPASIRTSISDTYVPAGATGFTVANARGLAVGDIIHIRRPTTPAWVKFMQMDTLTRDGRPQTWIGTNRSGASEHKVVAIEGNKLTIDVPLADSYDAKYLNPPGASVEKLPPSNRVTNVGIEQLRIQCPAIESSYGQHPYSAIRVNGEDCWVRDVFCDETMNATVIAGKRITMQRVAVKHTYPNLGASKPSDFSIEGSQILLDRCRITGGNTYFVWTSSLVAGPNVLLNCTFNGHGSRIQPHHRWATGMLVDNCRVPEGGIDFMNRGAMGSGHGWTMGWAVAWNCLAKAYVIQNPPGVKNWAIGCVGRRDQTARPFDPLPILAEGEFDSHGTPVTPQSLYLAQLEQRLGPHALKNIGYESNTPEALADPQMKRLPDLKTDVDPQLGPDLALHRPINASNIRGNSRQFGGEKAVDADPATFWATDDNARGMSIIVDTEGPLDINAIAIEEADAFHGRVEEYRVEGQINSDWQMLCQGTTVGQRKVDHFPKVTVWKVRLTIVKSDGHPAIRKLGMYLNNASP